MDRFSRVLVPRSAIRRLATLLLVGSLLQSASPVWAQVLEPEAPTFDGKSANDGKTANDGESAAVDRESLAVEKGLELERNRLWGDAVRHYETETRNHPASKTLYQRLVISRIHFDVNRRYRDESYLQSVRELTTNQTLDLYAEVLANLETHYVEKADWSRVQIHGTAALEVALTEEKFVDRLLAGVDREAIERFRLNVHHTLQNRSTATRFDLRANVAYVASLANQELGLSGTATVLEYLSGAVSTLDPYTRLLSPSQLDEMFSNIEGNFVGLGIELKAEADALQILSVIPKGPAEQGGIIAGEKIVRVEASRTNQVNPDHVADLLRGPENTFVSIAVLGIDGVERDMRIERRRVEVPCVENIHFVDVANRVGYMRLTNFQKTTTRDVERALWDLHRQGMRSLVIDVRGNPGGLLSAAVEVADRFLGSGRIVTTRGRNARENFDYIAHRPNTWNVPLAVLIDRNSASASEIFAGAIADSNRGAIVGETSYGKGSVQGIFRMQTAKFGLCMTTAKFYSPSGRAISQAGVNPSVSVEPTYIAARPGADGKMTLDRDDAVLQRAVEQFSGPSSKISRRP